MSLLDADEKRKGMYRAIDRLIAKYGEISKGGPELQRKFHYTMYYGAQDAAIDAHKSVYNGTNQPKYTRVVEHVTKTFHREGPSIIKHDLEVPVGLALANIRLQNPNWRKATFLIGRQVFSQYWRFFNLDPFFITNDGYCVPAVKYNGLSLEIEKEDPSGDLTIEYDIVEFPVNPDNKYEFLFKACQYTGSEAIDADSAPRIGINFNHPIEKIVAQFKNKVENVDLIIDGHRERAHPFKKISDTEYEIDFGEETLNFSRIDRANIEFTAGENEVKVYAISWHMARSISDMYGLSFTK